MKNKNPAASPAFDNEAERVFVEQFVVEHKVSRVLGQLDSKRGRLRLRRSLFHFADFDPRWIVPIKPACQNPSCILELLLANGARHMCNLMSAYDELDRLVIPLDEAIQTILGVNGGTIVICDPMRLAYFEGEHRGDRYILKRNANVQK